MASAVNFLIFSLCLTSFLEFTSASGLHIPGFINGKPFRHAMEKIHFPEADVAQDCPTLVNKIYKATVDNFDANNKDTWDQKYMENNMYVDPNTPPKVVFLNIGGEGPIGTQWACWSNYTYIKLAKKYNALIIQLEHRFFGESYPKKVKGLGDMSTASLSLLTSQQALADVHNFVQNYQYNGAALAGARWVAVGGSYPGSLCAWYRKMYPADTVGGICSSAPLWAKVDFFEYAEVMENTLKDYDCECAANVQVGFLELKQFTYSDAGRAKLNSIFKITPPLNPLTSNNFDMDSTNFLATVFNNFQGVVQYTFDARDNTTINGFGIDTLCSIMKATLSTGQTNVDRVKNVYFWAANTYGDTSGVVGNDYNAMMKPYQRVTFNTSIQEDQEIAAAKGWMWLCCGMALGWLQTTDSANSIFQNIIPLGFYMQYCTDMFGPTINSTTIVQKTAASAAVFSDPWNFAATNTLLPNGAYDPWHALGSYVSNPNDHQVPVLTQQAAHCSDMYPERPNEPKGLPYTRGVIAAEVDYYLTGNYVQTTVPPYTPPVKPTCAPVVAIPASPATMPPAPTSTTSGTTTTSTTSGTTTTSTTSGTTTTTTSGAPSKAPFVLTFIAFIAAFLW